MRGGIQKRDRSFINAAKAASAMCQMRHSCTAHPSTPLSFESKVCNIETLNSRISDLLSQFSSSGIPDFS